MRAHDGDCRRAGRFRSREYSGGAALDFLARAWPGLVAQDFAATAYQDPAWLLAWARQLPVGCELLVLAILDEEQPVAALRWSGSSPAADAPGSPRWPGPRPSRSGPWARARRR
ncbi:hypothetical protein [Streptomyces sp. NPDC051636]|uniref:hypothetical protein n=1 Tax=Streptomyces sp. NPDC051636 TaxID=3365663 RepID=UPI0037981380